MGFAYNWDTFRRNTGLNKSLQAVGKTNEQAFDLVYGMEYTFSNRTYSRMPENFAATPLMSWQYIFDHMNGYTETGAGNFNLSAQSHRPQSLTSVFGSRFDYLIVFSREYSLRTELDIGWEHEYLNRSQALGFTAFTITSTPTLATTVAPGRDSLLLTGDLLASFPHGCQVEAMCNYKYNELYYETFFLLTFKKLF